MIRMDRRGEDDSQRGFTLVEVLVSLMILMLLALTMYPILVQGLTVSAKNATLATATALVNGQLEGARAQTSCAAITNVTLTTVDERGVSLTVTRVRGTCPGSGYPTSVPVVASVTRVDTGVVLATAKTSIYVEAP